MLCRAAVLKRICDRWMAQNAGLPKHPGKIQNTPEKQEYNNSYET